MYVPRRRVDEDRVALDRSRLCGRSDDDGAGGDEAERGGEHGDTAGHGGSSLICWGWLLVVGGSAAVFEAGRRVRAAEGGEQRPRQAHPDADGVAGGDLVEARHALEPGARHIEGQRAADQARAAAGLWAPRNRLV